MYIKLKLIIFFKKIGYVRMKILEIIIKYREEIIWNLKDVVINIFRKRK